MHNKQCCLDRVESTIYCFVFKCPESFIRKMPFYPPYQKHDDNDSSDQHNRVHHIRHAIFHFNAVSLIISHLSHVDIDSVIKHPIVKFAISKFFDIT